MQIQQKKINNSIKFFIEIENNIIAWAYLYLLNNDIHKEPFGFMENVYVSETLRNKGIGTQLINEVIKEAKFQGCYKLICTSRYSNKKVHSFYEKFGFVDHGKEFRIDF